MTRALIALLVAGCTVPREAGFPDVQKLVGDRGVERIQWNRGGPEDEQVAALVRDLLQKDLTIATATEVALLNNARLQATYERLGVAQADLVQAGLLRNPTLAASLHVPISGGGPAFTAQTGYEVSIVGEFLDLFLMPLRKRFARAELERVKLDVGDAVLDLAAQVRAAFYTVQAAQQMAQMRATIVEAAQASAELAARQHEAGNLSDLDLASEQALYAQARLDLQRSQAQLLADREHLTELLGLWGRNVEWKLTAPLPDLPPAEPKLDHVETFAIEHRLDLKAARAEVEIAAASLNLTRKTRFISAASLGGHIDKDPEGVTFAGPNLELQLPIFDQGQASVARLAAQLRQAQKLMDARAVAIRSQVRAARARLLANRSAVEYYRATLLPIRERIVKLSQQRYNAMLLGVYQLLQARQAEANAYREYIEAVRDYWMARSDLERAMGGPVK